MTIENFFANVIALICVVGACLVIACLAAIAAYEVHRLYMCILRAWRRRRLNALIDSLRPMDEMIEEYYGGVK